MEESKGSEEMDLYWSILIRTFRGEVINKAGISFQQAIHHPYHPIEL